MEWQNRKQQKNSPWTFLDLVRQQEGSWVHRPDRPEVKPTTNTPLVLPHVPTWQTKNNEALEPLDKHQPLSRQWAEISQTSSPPDSRVSRVSCNSDECFPCADVKLQVHRKKNLNPAECCLSLYLDIKWLRGVSFLSHSGVFLMAASESFVWSQLSWGKILSGACHWPMWLHIHDASFSHWMNQDAIRKLNSTLWSQRAPRRGAFY